jgi:glyoxalase-like protein
MAISRPLSRRHFLALTGGALAVPSLALAADTEEDNDVPAMLDHIILGCNDLNDGIAFVHEGTGVLPAIGGVHPGRGTRNALLSLGERRYLEIIAPDPAQSEIAHFPQIRSMTDPRLIGWAVHPPDIAAIAKQLRENKIAFQGPDDGSRKRPDGQVLNWKTINLADDRHGLLPFFIEWSADSVHPSKDAPARCKLEYFEILSADPDELASTLKRMGLDFPVQRSDKARLHALISGPKGDLKLST